MDHLLGLIGLFLAAVMAGAINSVAGGGTLISFPALVAFGIPVISANATSTAAVCPGSLSSAFAYRRDLPEQRSLLLMLFLPSLIGGFLGAMVLARTPAQLFARIVPFLVLFATLLFASRDYFARLVRVNYDGSERISPLGRLWGSCFQLFVASYGGYFGAGIGILMLASLSLMGLKNIHKMNAVKTILGATINGTALIYFIWRGLIVWPLALMMAAGAVTGGYFGAVLAKSIDQKYLRLFIIAVGVLVSIWLFVR